LGRLSDIKKLDITLQNIKNKKIYSAHPRFASSAVDVSTGSKRKQTSLQSIPSRRRKSNDGSARGERQLVAFNHKISPNIREAVHIPAQKLHIICNSDMIP
jgi:hypothetical protein